MELKCEICQKSFEWTRPASSHGGARTPKICSNPECKRTRAHKSYLKWKASHPDRLKQHSHAQYERRKTKKIQPKYFRKAVPKAKIKHYCKYHGCKRQTARNGTNRLYCQRHWDLLQEGCSSEYQGFIYEDSNFEDIHTTPTVYDIGH